MRFNKIFWALALIACADSVQGAGCSIRSVPTLGFGSYNIASTGAATTTQTAQFHCDGPGVAVAIGFGPSSTSASITNRKLAQSGGPDRLTYNIYKNAGFSVLWGDGSAGTTPLLLTTPSANFQVQVFGRIDPGQDVGVGNYTDSVVMTITP